MKKIKVVLLASVLVNALFVLALGVLVYNRGGIGYLQERAGIFLSSEEEAEYNHHYLSRRSLFETISVEGDNGTFFVGDSITEGNEWSEVYDDLSIKNRGVGWDTTAGLIDRIDTIIDSQPNKIFLMIGTNDIDAGISPEETISNYEIVLEAISNSSPDTIVYIQSILPVNEGILNSRTRTNTHITDLNNDIETLANEKGLTYIDLVPDFLDSNSELNSDLTFDGLHLKGEGYSIWQNAIDSYVIN